MLLRAILTAALLLLYSSASVADARSEQYADEFPSEVASTWFELLYDVVKTEKTTPPPASRIYGITSVALYESIVAGTKRDRSLAGQLNGLTSVPQPDKEKEHYWPAVANSVLANTIRGLYPKMWQDSLEKINRLEQKFASEYRAQVPTPVYERSAAYGRSVAGVMLMWAATDGYAIHNNCPYVPASVAGAWRPTPPPFSPEPLQPCWGLIRPMVLSSGQECAASGHPPFSNNTRSAFYPAGVEVYNVGLGLTNEQKTIADYWADNPGATGTPPGHWIAIVSQIARRDGLSLAQATEAYARVGIAVHDSFIGCWNTKFAYNLRRPATYINDNLHGMWRPYVVTPNFPSYPSGHAVQSAAAARTLTDMFGNKSFRDTTHVDHGLVPPQKPRTFKSFHDAAAEAALSRLYGGIHYSFDNNDGLTSGKCIGQAIHDRVNFKVDEHVRNPHNRTP